MGKQMHKMKDISIFSSIIRLSKKSISTFNYSIDNGLKSKGIRRVQQTQLLNN